MTHVPEENIIVTGSNGQLGSELQALHSDEKYNWIFTTRDDFDMTDPASVEALFAKYHPKWLVNCAAYTTVDKAESDRENALAVNADALTILAKACKKYDTALVHISTDYVFNGQGTAPYLPEQPTEPVNFYGETKLLGEQNALANNDKTIIIRTSWVYSFFGKNFVKTMRMLMSTRDELNVVSDQQGSPTYASDLAEAIIEIIYSDQQEWGIYHFSNEGEISWYDFAVAIRDLSGLECRVNPVPTTAFPTPAKRPSYSVMDTKKIQKNYHIAPRYWVQSLKECITLLDKVN